MGDYRALTECAYVRTLVRKSLVIVGLIPCFPVFHPLKTNAPSLDRI